MHGSCLFVYITSQIILSHVSLLRAGESYSLADGVIARFLIAVYFAVVDDSLKVSLWRSGHYIEPVVTVYSQNLYCHVCPSIATHCLKNQ